ncbi:hypothetical protein V1477_006079 [Vespula maculifrons]|uniref:Uncharacterized protein n=2 Tax=Vespula TaxID=7451 RepID=A0A834J958_VESGE|nr:hypothetical protein HZH68_014512 [Vespula germanica]
MGNYRNELVPIETSRDPRATRVRKLWNSILRLLRRIYWQSKESSLRGNGLPSLPSPKQQQQLADCSCSFYELAKFLRGKRSAQILQVRYRSVRKFKSSLSFPVTDKIDAAATTTRTGIAATAAATAAGAGGPISVP